MDFAINNWDDVIAIASVLATFVAIIAALFAWRQFTLQAKIARELRATEVWEDYLRLCVEHPELSSESAFSNYFGRLPNLNYERNDKDDERYLWFLSVLLNACQQIILNVPSRDSWKTVIQSQLVYHQKTLPKVWELGEDRLPDDVAWSPHYTKAMQQLVELTIYPVEIHLEPDTCLTPSN